MKKIIKILICLSFFHLIFYSTCLAQTESSPLELPETIEEGKEAVKEGTEKIFGLLPGIIKRVWEGEVIPIWQKMWQWVKGVWKNYAVKSFDYIWRSNLKPAIKNIAQSIKNKIGDLIGHEIIIKKEVIEEEIEKEKEEIKRDISQSTHSLWQRFKDLFK
jgi:hypothetical protein